MSAVVSASQNDDLVKLAPPGAGLPWIEHLLARFFFFPRFCKKTTWDEAQAIFEKEGMRLVQLVQPLGLEELNTPVLIPRIQGIEDSSRFWSVTMTLEHLITVGDQISQGIVKISQGESPSGKADIAAVKPKGRKDPKAILQEYQTFVRRFTDRMTGEVKDRESDTRYHHPWFGELTAHQWHCLAAAHQNIHRKQVQEILKGMRGELRN